MLNYPSSNPSTCEGHERPSLVSCGRAEGRSLLWQPLIFRGKSGQRLKIPAWDGSGLCLFAKRRQAGKSVWPRLWQAAWC
ncbi:IS66 family insertion sequence element accessory protein TnpB [Zavarzinia sp. CC-PAN008]|uniref:IS66 family insertion sequence element accessory protein TnpB n=1 Tax=Zavarzinia sp. CC-PAN008 TaxID=3243332 RepID=UPI003F747489